MFLLFKNVYFDNSISSSTFSGKAKDLRSWKYKFHHHFYSGRQLIMHSKYFPFSWNHTYKLCFTVQKITTALAEYRSKHFVSLGACASSTVKIEAIIPAKLLLATELQVHQFAPLQLAWSWRGCTKANSLFASRVCSVWSRRTIPWSHNSSAPAESQIPFPPSDGVWAALLPHSLLGVLHAPSDLSMSHETLRSSEN